MAVLAWATNCCFSATLLLIEPTIEERAPHAAEIGAAALVA